LSWRVESGTTVSSIMRARNALNARPAGPCPAAHDRARTAPAASCTERRGGHPAAAGGAGAEVQSSARHRRSLPGEGRGAGLRVSEVVALKVGDVDCQRMLLGSSRARAARTATPCCRRSCSSCCAPGGARGGAWACCCRGAGCFPAAIRSSRCRPASSTAPSIPPPRPPGSRSACLRTRCGTALPRTCSNRIPTSASIQVLLGHAKLDTTALYTRVANATIRPVTSPLDRRITSDRRSTGRVGEARSGLSRGGDGAPPAGL